MDTLATREPGEVTVSNWVLLLIRQKKRMTSRIAGRIHFKLSTSQGLLGRFYSGDIDKETGRFTPFQSVSSQD